MRRPIAAVVAAAAAARSITTAAAAAVALWLVAAPASALTRQPSTDVTPRGAGLILCPAELGGASGLAWLRFTETASHRDVFHLGAAGVDPPTPTARLQSGGGCPATATAPSGASLIALSRSGFTNETGRVYAVDRAAGGATGPPIALSANNRGTSVTGALASSGAALVAWTETSEVTPQSDREDTTVAVAARDAGGAFRRLAAMTVPGEASVSNLAAGVDEAGYGIVVWTQRSLAGDRFVSRVMVASRAPGGALAAPRELAAEPGSAKLDLFAGATGEVLLAYSAGNAIRVATGTTRTGLDAPRTLGAAAPSDVQAVLTASGAATVAWSKDPDADGKGEGIHVSDRPAGGDFGAPHALATPGARVGGVETSALRLAAAADGRVLATWVTGVAAGDGWPGSIPVAALRRADGSWESPVAVAGTCRVPLAAFGGFDGAGQPRAIVVDSGYVSVGDYGFPADTRVRRARLAGIPATPPPPPKVTLTAPRRQVLRDGEVRLRVRCERACDALVFAVVDRESGAGSGLYPRWARLRAGRTLRVALRRQSYFDATDDLDRPGTTARVKLVAHACDSAGRIARARRTIGVRIPRAGSG